MPANNLVSGKISILHRESLKMAQAVLLENSFCPKRSTNTIGLINSEEVLIRHLIVAVREGKRSIIQLESVAKETNTLTGLPHLLLDR